MKSRSPAIASLRASQWLHFCGLPLAGLGAENMRMDPDGWMRALVGGLIAAGCLGCAYGVNAAADRHTDRCSRKNPLVADPGRVAPAIACALLVALVALTLALAVGRVAPLACGLSLVCGLAYSLGGKRVPVLGLVLNAGIFAPLMAVLLVPGAVPPTWAHELAVFTALLIQNQLIHELADDEEDRAAGAGTTAQLLGGAGAVYLAVAVGLAVPLISPWLAPPRHALLAALLAAIATGIAAAARRDPARARVLHRVTACVGGALLWLWARLPG